MTVDPTPESPGDLRICARLCCSNLVIPPARPQLHPKIYCSDRCARKAANARRQKRKAAKNQAARSAAGQICAALGCGKIVAVGERGPVPIYCSKRCAGLIAERDYRSAARRIARAGFGAPIEIFANFEILDRDGWICQICRVSTPAELRGTKAPAAPQVDHKIPISKGGGHTRENCWCLCFRCNRRKADKLLAELDWYKPAQIDAGG